MYDFSINLLSNEIKLEDKVLYQTIEYYAYDALKGVKLSLSYEDKVANIFVKYITVPNSKKLMVILNGYYAMDDLYEVASTYFDTVVFSEKLVMYNKDKILEFYNDILRKYEKNDIINNIKLVDLNFVSILDLKDITKNR